MNLTLKQQQQINAAIAKLHVGELFCLQKRGLLYRENAQGYTSDFRYAWKLPLEEARQWEMYVGRNDVSPDEIVKAIPASVQDYCGSLDAMHEAEKNVNSKRPYMDTLCDVMGLTSGSSYIVFATAKQRAIAFLRWMNPNALEDMGL